MFLVTSTWFMSKRLIPCFPLSLIAVLRQFCFVVSWFRQTYDLGSRTRLSNFTFTFHFHALEKEMAAPSSILAWRIPWNQETGSLLSAAATAKSLQSCPTLCDPRDSSPPGFSVPGILQARVLEWGAIAFSNEDNGKLLNKTVVFDS